MNKQEIILIIERLYPADTKFDDNQIGMRLLEKAKIFYGYTEFYYDWRDYPYHVLNKYLELCQEFNERAKKELFVFLEKEKING